MANGNVQSTGGTVTAALTQAAMDYLNLKGEVDAQNTKNAALTAVEMAVQAAEAAALALNSDSTAEDEAAVDVLITTAQTQVTSATALTEEELQTFNSRLGAAQASRHNKQKRTRCEGG